MDNKTNYEQEILNAVIDRIDMLRVKSGMTIYKLAQESLLSDSSLKKLYTRQHFPNVLTIYRICDALQISVSEFFAFNIDSAKLVDEKVILLSSYDALSPNNKRLILELIQNLKSGQWVIFQPFSCFAPKFTKNH